RRHTRFSRDWSSDVCSSDLFSVHKAFRDYSGQAEQDISARFELVRISPQTLSLRLLPGQVLEHNAQYRVQIEGIQDLAGNQPLKIGRASCRGRARMDDDTEQ